MATVNRNNIPPPASLRARPALARLWLNWPLWGGLLAMLLLAHHAWRLFAPADRAMPAHTQASAAGNTGDLFGTVQAAAATPLDGFSVIGIFAHPTAGFAVLQTPQGQRGVALGHEVAGGVTLIETQSDHVLLQRNGQTHRLDLVTTAPASATNTAPAASAATTTTATRTTSKK